MATSESQLLSAGAISWGGSVQTIPQSGLTTPSLPSRPSSFFFSVNRVRWRLCSRRFVRLSYRPPLWEQPILESSSIEHLNVLTLQTDWAAFSFETTDMFNWSGDYSSADTSLITGRTVFPLTGYLLSIKKSNYSTTLWRFNPADNRLILNIQVSLQTSNILSGTRWPLVFWYGVPTTSLLMNVSSNLSPCSEAPSSQSILDSESPIPLLSSTLPKLIQFLCQRWRRVALRSSCSCILVRVLYQVFRRSGVSPTYQTETMTQSRGTKLQGLKPKAQSPGAREPRDLWSQDRGPRSQELSKEGSLVWIRIIPTTT